MELQNHLPRAVKAAVDAVKNDGKELEKQL
jgi:hypothetical protein